MVQATGKQCFSAFGPVQITVQTHGFFGPGSLRDPGLGFAFRIIATLDWRALFRPLSPELVTGKGQRIG